MQHIVASTSYSGTSGQLINFFLKFKCLAGFSIQEQAALCQFRFFEDLNSDLDRLVGWLIA